MTHLFACNQGRMLEKIRLFWSVLKNRGTPFRLIWKSRKVVTFFSVKNWRQICKDSLVISTSQSLPCTDTASQSPILAGVCKLAVFSELAPSWCGIVPAASGRLLHHNPTVVHLWNQWGRGGGETGGKQTSLPRSHYITGHVGLGHRRPRWVVRPQGGHYTYCGRPSRCL